MKTHSEKEKQEKRELMRQIKDEIIVLESSLLCKERITNKTLPVIGEGSHFAKIMFVGEAPGKNEAVTGKPFCGRSGQILDELLESIGVPRQEVYVTNIVKDRPTQNRDPLPEEIEIYGPFLDRQIDIIQPKVIATLGRFSMDYIMKKFDLDFEIEPISKAHAKTFDAKTSYGEVKIIPLYHPAVAIYNSHSKDTLKKDFEVLKEYATN